MNIKNYIIICALLILPLFNLEAVFQSINGELNISVGGNESVNSAEDGSIYSWYADQTIPRLHGEDWPLINGLSIYSNEYVLTSPVLGNFDADYATKEILVVTGSENWDYYKIHIYDYNGENAVDTVEIDYRPSFNPIVADIDNDGTEEVIIGSEDGEVYLYKVPIVEHGTNIDELIAHPTKSYPKGGTYQHGKRVAYKAGKEVKLPQERKTEKKK